jgi:predicted secreted protein
MTPSRPSIPQLYAHWMTAWWSALSSVLPKDLIEQDWEVEGGAPKSATSKPSGDATRAQA